MTNSPLPPPDSNGIISLFQDELSPENNQRNRSFSRSAWVYDLMQEYFVRPHIHKVDPCQHRKTVKAILAPAKNKRVLDIACGTGSAIQYLDRSHRYTGLDLSYRMLKRAVKKGAKKNFSSMQFIQANAEQQHFPEHCFDLIVMDTALHMIPNYQAAIGQIARVLDPQGVFICSTPAMGINAEFDVVWSKMAGKRGIHSFCIADLEKVCFQHQLSFEQYAVNGGMIYFKARKIEF